MKLLTTTILGLALALPLAANAKPNPGHGNGNTKLMHTAPGHSAKCPPGLAKKSPACVPPGLTKSHDIRVGDVLDGSGYGSEYILIRDPGRYALEPFGTYYRVNNQVIQVDRETSEVVALIGAVTDILN